MQWPKRFKLHEAAAKKAGDVMQTEVIQTTNGSLIAVDGVGFAIVPLLDAQERPGADLPRLTSGEEPPVGILPPKAIQEASYGKEGQGLLQVFPDTVETQRGDGKPWTRFERPEIDPSRILPPVGDVEAIVSQPAPEGAQHIELMVDAEALVRLSRAIGAGANGVRLRFLVSDSGRCDAQSGAHGLIEVRPVGELENGARAILAAVIVDR